MKTLKAPIPVVRHAQFWIIATIITFGIIWMISDVLVPFVLGIAIAYLFHPLVSRLTKRRFPRWAAALLVLLLFFTALVGMILAFVPMFIDQVNLLMASLPGYLDTLRDKAQPIMKNLSRYLSDKDYQSLRQAVSNSSSQVGAIAATVLTSAWRGGQIILGIIGLFVIMPVVAFYLLRDWPMLLGQINRSLPRGSAVTIRTQARKVDDVLSGFLRGQLSVCFILGLIYAIGLTFVGLDFGFTLGLITGLLTFVPYVGNFIGLATALALGVAQFGFGHELLGIGAVFGVGQFLESNFITPKLVGEKVGLHPLWIIFAIMAGGSLLGFIGVLLAVPVAAVLGVVIRYAYGKYLKSPYYKIPPEELPKVEAK